VGGFSPLEATIEKIVFNPVDGLIENILLPIAHLSIPDTYD
jgi:hypothetical protein